MWMSTKAYVDVALGSESYLKLFRKHYTKPTSSKRKCSPLPNSLGTEKANISSLQINQAGIYLVINRMSKLMVRRLFNTAADLTCASKKKKKKNWPLNCTFLNMTLDVALPAPGCVWVEKQHSRGYEALRSCGTRDFLVICSWSVGGSPVIYHLKRCVKSLVASEIFCLWAGDKYLTENSKEAMGPEETTEDQNFKIREKVLSKGPS